jgi:hypothetical protein
MEKKNVMVRFRVSSEELDKIKNKADILGISISAFSRLVVLGSNLEVVGYNQATNGLQPLKRKRLLSKDGN